MKPKHLLAELAQDLFSARMVPAVSIGQDPPTAVMSTVAATDACQTAVLTAAALRLLEQEQPALALSLQTHLIRSMAPGPMSPAAVDH